MDQRRHAEQHFLASDTVRDIVIGMSDGLTVPFALAAGMTGVAVAPAIVVTAGLAEIAAGSISMGLGGYLAARTEAEHYQAERSREEQEIVDRPEDEAREAAGILRGIGVDEAHVEPVVDALRNNRPKMLDLMMRFELGLEEPNPRRAPQSAATIAGAYAISGLIPLAPYMLMSNVTAALYVSASVTLVALFLFGYLKGRITGLNALPSAIQTVVLGGIAAGVAFAIARLIG